LHTEQKFVLWNWGRLVLTVWLREAYKHVRGRTYLCDKFVQLLKRQN